MTVIARKANKRSYSIPEEGSTLATLKEVKDMGEVPTGFGSKPKVRFMWETDDVDDTGNHFRIFESFNNTLHPSGRLAPRLKSITGEMPDENEDFNLSALEGTRVQLVIVHNTSDGITYANVSAVIRLKTQAETRKEDEEAARVRKVESAITRRNAPVVAKSVPTEDEIDEITDEDIPF